MHPWLCLKLCPVDTSERCCGVEQSPQSQTRPANIPESGTQKTKVSNILLVRRDIGNQHWQFSPRLYFPRPAPAPDVPVVCSGMGAAK